MPAQPTCSKCAAQPTGIEGHDGLFTFRIGNRGLQFKCRACDLLWTRSYLGEGDFKWSTELDAAPGVEAPGHGA